MTLKIKLKEQKNKSRDRLPRAVRHSRRHLAISSRDKERLPLAVYSITRRETRGESVKLESASDRRWRRRHLKRYGIFKAKGPGLMRAGEGEGEGGDFVVGHWGGGVRGIASGEKRFGF